jgi:hypothetical protein
MLNKALDCIQLKEIREVLAAMSKETAVRTKRAEKLLALSRQLLASLT